MSLRLGAVSYLNSRPLVYGLDRLRDRFDVRFDVPSRCAALLHENHVDLGLIPSIEYLHGPDYRIVPGVAIASDGPVASVTLFSRRQTSEIRTVALDTSSRTSVALLRILCARWFDIRPSFVPMSPDLSGMLAACDAALVIGDNALFAGGESAGLERIDLGEEWIGMTGLPFVYAFWAGRAGVIRSGDVAALRRARDEGLLSIPAIAAQSFPDEPAQAAIAGTYLRENIKYDLGEREEAGLRRFYELALEIGLVEKPAKLGFYSED